MRHVVITVMAVASIGAVGARTAAEQVAPTGLERWGFLVGDWDLVERRFGFDSNLIETKTGHASFTWVMNGERIQEFQEISRDAVTASALQTFVYDPRSEEIEIARTDSGHYGFWVIVGTMSNDRLVLKEKHPDPASEITRRISYIRKDADHFVRQLEFSTDRGNSWFVRSEATYTRD